MDLPHKDVTWRIGRGLGSGGGVNIAPLIVCLGGLSDQRPHTYKTNIPIFVT
jgi:hypothetical protein